MATIDEKTKVPLGLVVAAIGAIVALASAAAVAQYRIGDHGGRLEKVEDAEHVHDVHLGEHDAVLRGMKDTLDRIDRNVEGMKR